MDKCKDCIYFMPHKMQTYNGYCRRLPKNEPKILGDWCGEFRHIAEQAAIEEILESAANA